MLTHLIIYPQSTNTISTKHVGYLIVIIIFICFLFPSQIITYNPINYIVSQTLSNFYGNEGSSSLACLHHICDGICLYGAMGRRSFSALTLNNNADATHIPMAQTTVFLFHATGVGHHPPAGDHTYMSLMI